MTEKSVLELAPFAELDEGQILSKNDISLINLHISLLIENAKKEYIRGYNDGYYEGRGKNNGIQAEREQ
jgi:hypothetical protein